MSGRIFLLIIMAKSIVAQTVTLSPSPTAYVSVNNPLTLTCTTTYSMRFLFIRDSTLVTGVTAITVGNNGGNCLTLTIVPGYEINCDSVNGPYQITIKSVNFQRHNSSITCTIQYGGSSTEDISSAGTTIKVNDPLQRVSLTPNGTITMTESETLVFQCFARSLPIASLSWRLNGSLSPTSSPPVTNNDSVTSFYTYIARKSDHGKKLSCTAVHVSASFTEDALLNVLYRPTVTIYPSYTMYTVIENTSNIELQCTVADANPNVTSYRWYKNGSVVDGTAASYIVSKVQRSHTGRYTCVAINSVGSSDLSAIVQLIVMYGVEIDPITKQEPAEMSQLLISCNVRSYPAVTNKDVIWTKQHNATFQRTGQLLVISNVNKMDNGIFVCSVVITLTPTIGQPVIVTGSTNVEVDVLYRPKVTVSPELSEYYVIENTTNLKLACVVTEANPTVKSYRWYKNNAVIINVAAYTILSVHRSDIGSYTCDATNAVGSSLLSSAIQLIILYGVELNSISTKTPIEGNQLIISCTGQSYPKFTNHDVKWTKQNNNTFRRVGQQLIINNINKVDTGTYDCFVVLQLVPSVGQSVNVTGRTTVEVNILYRPDVAISPVRNPFTVIENTTTFHLTCNVTDANPAVTSYRWYKDGVKVSTAATYIIPKVYRSHTGSYACDASNTVGSSDPSSVLQLNVLYGVSLILSRSEINIDESDRWDFSCIGDGNPLPNIVCVYGNNGTTAGEQKNNPISISVDHANCVDTGYYVCSGNNTIGEPVSQSAEIKVACKPRTYNNLDTEDIFMRTTDEGINISTTFISFPLSHISWSRELSDGHFADLDSSFNSSIISSHLPYETQAILQKDQLKSNEFGIYIVNASNIYGSFLMKYHFIQKRDPILPSYVYVVCKTATAIVILKPIVNENLPQDLYIQYAVEGKDMISIKVYTNKANQPNKYTVTGLNPGRKYNFSILAVNQYGETRSNQFECLTETLSYSEDMLAINQGNGGMFSAGIASLVVGLLFFVAATIFIFRKRFKKTYTKSSKSDDYADLQASNPAFQDPYTSIHNPIESRHHQESSANTYEECGNASDAAAYQNIENIKSGHKKVDKNMGIYDNMKI